MLATPNKHSLEKELLLPESSMDKQQGLVESRLQPTSSSFTKFATFPKAIIWSLIAWLAIFFLICSANALPTSIKDTLSSVGGKDHFSRRGILSVSSSSNSCQGSLVNWNKALMAVLPTKNLKIETLEGPIYGTIEVRTGDVTNTQRMPEVYFSASVTQNDNTAGLQLNQNAPGSTISTFTLSVAPLPASPVPYCSFVNITVVIPVDATAPYYDGELEFVTEYMDVKTTTNIGQLSIAKFSFRSSLGDLYAPSLRTKTLNATFTEGTVTIDSLRPYDNESPITALIHTSGDIKLAFKTSPASQGEWVPRPVKIEADVDDAILNVVLAEGQKLNMYVKPFWSALVSVSDNYLGPLNMMHWSWSMSPLVVNGKPGSASRIVYEQDTANGKIGVKQIPGGSAGIEGSSITIDTRVSATLNFI
ncbi:hypothetical protein BGZ97_013305 [Linnemannia gamsii]|uniref:Uncharacterized protein n=1 Tax=Linnemannia gamsii TaxID=64522 RepID=A0A9P6R0P0_9FUNG|nr:hypothetical protein BGZ97_013305 [Linnemannia gamsii]